MKVLGYIFDIFCRILAVVYSIIFIPVLGITTVILMTATILFGIFEWIFTGDGEYCWNIIEWLTEDAWKFIIGVPKKLVE